VTNTRSCAIVVTIDSVFLLLLAKTKPAEARALSLLLRTKDSTTSKNQLGEAIPEVKPVERKALVLVSAKMKLSSLKQEFHREHLCSQRK
jgi:hypothetical protein